MINPFAGYRLAGAVGSKVFAEELPVRAGPVVVARRRVDLVDLVACGDGIAVDVEPPLLLVHRRLRGDHGRRYYSPPPPPPPTLKAWVVWRSKAGRFGHERVMGSAM